MKTHERLIKNPTSHPPAQSNGTSGSSAGSRRPEIKGKRKPGLTCYLSRPMSNGSAGLPRKDGLHFHFSEKHGKPLGRGNQG